MTDYDKAVIDVLLKEAAIDALNEDNKWNLYKYYKNEIYEINLTSDEYETVIKQLTNILGI